MARCSRCGKGGLFKKVDKITGLCADCALLQRQEEKLKAVNDQIDAKEKLLTDKEKLLADAIAAAKTQAMRQVEFDFQRQSSALADLKNQIRDAEARRDTLIVENTDAQKALDSAVRRNERLKPLAKSIQYAAENWLNGEVDKAKWLVEGLSIEELLPEPDLNCLTMKQLRSRYNNLRKQIVELCKSNEERYTTKSNAAMYKLMVLAMEAELETVLYKLQFGRLEVGIDAVKRMTARYYQIAAEGNQSIAPTLQRFIGQIESLYLDVVSTEYEYYVQRERAKEEQRALREQMRQEAEERKQLERERKKVEAEEQKYRQEIERIEQEMREAQGSELENLQNRLAEVNTLMGQVESKKEEIINLQNGKAGTVYIISNIGSFGENVFKVGMTRRLDPEDRVNELGSASVPFPFDIHSLIFSQDAPALETALHHELNDRRINKVNLRKEFFNVSAEELQQMVERYDPTAAFRVTALAEQYRQSLSITEVPENIDMIDDGEEDDE